MRAPAFSKDRAGSASPFCAATQGGIMPTKKELSLIIMGMAGIALLFYCRADWWRIAIFNYCFGFVFETSMEPLFTYHKDLQTARCVRNSDINCLYPLGWMLIFACIYYCAVQFFANRWYGHVLCGFVVGTVFEFMFHRLHFWKYHYSKKWLGLFRPFMPKITWLGGIPVQISLSYGLSVGTFVWFIMNKMFPE
jgi:hypothetical protein